MRNYTITEIWDIPIRVNISLLIFLPILAWLIGSGGQIEIYAGFIEQLTGVGFDISVLRAGLMPWVIGITAAVGLFVSVTLHELGHSWVALRYGVEIESITLWILGGIASLKSIPREWNREFWIAIVGPITSILIGIVCYAGVYIIPSSLQVVRFIFGWLAVTNIILAVFNLIPAFPMDGGRILRALLARSRSYGSATRIAARIGVVFAFLFAIVGILNFQIILILLAFFIYAAATTESRTVLIDELLEGITVGDIMQNNPVHVSADSSLDDFGKQMLQDRQSVHLVVDENENPVGIITLNDIKAARGKDRASTTVREVMQEVPVVEATADAFDTLSMLNQSGKSNALVEKDGAFVGIITQSDFSEAVTIQRGFQSRVPM